MVKKRHGRWWLIVVEFEIVGGVFVAQLPNINNTVLEHAVADISLCHRRQNALEIGRRLRHRKVE